MPAFCDISKREQEELLIRQIEYAKANSQYYKQSLKQYSINSLDQLPLLPFTDAECIKSEGRRFVCIPASDIKRIVTVSSSSTNGPAKRIYFSRNDLERTVDFFCEGMQLMMKGKEKAAILLENLSENGVSNTLSKGLSKFGAKPFCIGMDDPIGIISERLTQIKPDVIIGMPWLIRLLAITNPLLKPKCVLLSADYIPEGLPAMITSIWGSKVLCHFGMTESVYGCAVESPKSKCMLLRKNEYIAEIIDPITNKRRAASQAGELVLTSLRREAMPLIRYKTGDIAILNKEGNLIRILGRKDVHSDYYILEDFLSEYTPICDFKLIKGKLTVMIFESISSQEEKELLSKLNELTAHMSIIDNIRIDRINEKAAFLFHKGKHVKSFIHNN